jgi:hypothetical protein
MSACGIACGGIAWRPIGDDEPNLFLGQPRGDVRERRIVADTRQVCAVAALTLSAIDHASLRNGCRIRAAAGGARSTGAPRRLGAQLVNRWNVDAQDVNGTVSGIRRSRAPVRAALRARDGDCLNATAGGMNKLPLRAAAIRAFQVSRSSGVRMY